MPGTKIMGGVGVVMVVIVIPFPLYYIQYLKKRFSQMIYFSRLPDR